MREEGNFRLPPLLYIKISYERLKQLEMACLKTRPMNTPIYRPGGQSNRPTMMKRKHKAHPSQTRVLIFSGPTKIVVREKIEESFKIFFLERVKALA